MSPLDHRTLLLAIAVALFGVTALGGAWAGAGWLWDAANGLGFAAATLIVFLHVETGAARNRPAPQAAFHARLHMNLAQLVLALVAAHALALLADDALTLEYWKPSAPPYMLAGIAAALLLVAIVAMAYPRPRRAAFATPTHFRRAHAGASIAMATLVAWHIAGSGLYLDTRIKQTAFALLAVALPLWLLARPDRRRPLVAAPRLDAEDARRETRRVGAAALVLAIVFTTLRNVL